MGNITSVFNPQCKIPLFQQTHISIVKECSTFTGLLISFYLTVFIVVFIFFMLFLFKRKANDTDKEYKYRRKMTWVAICFLIVACVLIWIFLPFYMRTIGISNWEGYREQLDTLVHQGYSYTEALSKIQSLYENERIYGNLFLKDPVE